MGMKVSAVIVTRGNVDLSPIIASFPEDWEGVIWNNGNGTVVMGGLAFGGSLLWQLSQQGDSIKVPDLSVYGRYAAIKYATHPLIFIQDDDCIISDPERIVWESDSGGSEYGRLICNMPPQFRHDFYTDHSLVGFGACFHRDLPDAAFKKFAQGYTWEHIATFKNTCDVVFTTLTPHVLVDVPVENLPWATGPDRMYRQKEHLGERKQMLKLALKVKNG